MNEEKYVRPDWDTYWMEMMEVVSKRATCNRGRSGCVIVRDNKLLTTGYVGSPPGLPHCDDVGHLFKNVAHLKASQGESAGSVDRVTQHCVRTIHAEMNAILQAAEFGISIKGATLYCRMTPCRGCAMAIIRVGIKRVVAQRIYQAAQETFDMFEKVGIELVHIENKLQTY